MQRSEWEYQDCQSSKEKWQDVVIALLLPEADPTRQERDNKSWYADRLAGLRPYLRARASEESVQETHGDVFEPRCQIESSSYASRCENWSKV